MKTRQLLEKLFETDDVDADAARQAIRHYMSQGHDIETAKEMAFKQNLPKPRPAISTGHTDRLRAAAARTEANFHSPEERAQLGAIRKPGANKLRQPHTGSDQFKAKAMLMALPSVQGRGQL